MAICRWQEVYQPSAVTHLQWLFVLESVYWLIIYTVAQYSPDSGATYSALTDVIGVCIRSWISMCETRQTTVLRHCGLLLAVVSIVPRDGLRGSSHSCDWQLYRRSVFEWIVRRGQCLDQRTRTPEGITNALDINKLLGHAWNCNSENSGLTCAELDERACVNKIQCDQTRFPLWWRQVTIVQYINATAEQCFCSMEYPLRWWPNRYLRFFLRYFDRNFSWSRMLL
jgi:hypothetical protein